MFIRPELRKGDVDIRVKAPADMVEKLGLAASALGLTRQDVVLVALDAYVQELSHVARILSVHESHQRNRNGIATDGERRK